MKLRGAPDVSFRPVHEFTELFHFDSFLDGRTENSFINSIGAWKHSLSHRKGMWVEHPHLGSH